MARKVTFKLNARELEVAAKFTSDIGISLEHLAKQCLFHTMQSAYAAAQQVHNQVEGELANGVGPLDDTGTVAQVQDADSSAGLENSEPHNNT